MRFLFVAGILVGLAIQTALPQNQDSGIVGLNHVGISVPDRDEAANYTKTAGFPEAFRNFDEKGQPTLVYVQISGNTFVELQPARPERPLGINHFGVHVENIDVATAMFKRRGADVSEETGQSNEGHLVEHHRSESRPSRAGRARCRVATPAGDGTMAIVFQRKLDFGLAALAFPDGNAHHFDRQPLQRKSE